MTQIEEIVNLAREKWPNRTYQVVLDWCDATDADYGQWCFYAIHDDDTKLVVTCADSLPTLLAKLKEMKGAEDSR